MKKFMMTNTQTAFHFTAVLFLILLALSVLSLPVRADDTNIKPTGISISGQKKVTVNAGCEFELKVNMAPANADDDFLEWTILSGKKQVSFDEDTLYDDDRYDDEVELIAKKAGTAKIRCSIRGTSTKVTFKIKVKKASNKISASGTSKKTVGLGNEFELKVNKNANLSDRYLQWSIKDTSIVDFEDEDRYDDEMEFIAKKTGTTTITCKNTKTNQSVNFKVTVVGTAKGNHAANVNDDVDDDSFDHDDNDDDD